MATILLDRLWLNAAADLTDVMSFDLNSVEYDPIVQVSSRQYAGGNFRMITTPGKQQVAKVLLGFCSDDQTDWLDAHQGLLVCYRDPNRKFYGFFSDSTFTPRFMGDSWSVPLTVQQVTWSEVA